jgi:hypothetical protein
MTNCSLAAGYGLWQASRGADPHRGGNTEGFPGLAEGTLSKSSGGKSSAYAVVALFATICILQENISKQNTCCSAHHRHITS